MAADKYVLYLKNGTLFYCQDYWHVQGEAYHVRISRHTAIDIPENQVFAAGVIHRHALPDYQLDYKYDDSAKTYVKLPDYFIREHGFFLTWQTSLIMIDGMQVMMGYRINRYLALGIGAGAGYGATLGEPITGNYPANPTAAASYVYNSGYSPFFLYITGDILKTGITPFYSLEGGYNLSWYPHLQTNDDDGANWGPYNYYTNYGGPTAGLGLGCRIRSRRRSIISISVNMNVGYVTIKTDGFEGLSGSNPNTYVYVTSTSKYIMTQPSVRFSLGF